VETFRHFFVIKPTKYTNFTNVFVIKLYMFRTVRLSVQWINSWWWTDELSETCRVSWRNKFLKLVHLVGFITKKFVTMHGHMNVKFRHLFEDRGNLSFPPPPPPPSKKDWPVAGPTVYWSVARDLPNKRKCTSLDVSIRNVRFMFVRSSFSSSANPGTIKEYRQRKVTAYSYQHVL
jgi:hypothetical protein